MRTTTLPQELPRGPRLLDDDQRDVWHDAVASVDEVADGTDSASASKAPLVALQRLVRVHPLAVIEEIDRVA